MNVARSLIPLLLLAACGCDRRPAPAASAGDTAPATNRASTAPIPTDVRAETVAWGGHSFRVVRLDPMRLELFWRDGGGALIGNPGALADQLAATGRRVVFATNAGIFDPSHKPLGLHVENRAAIVPLNDADGAGNFFLKPNGVFFVRDDGSAIVSETGEFVRAQLNPRVAVQSGPLLLRDGKVHPAFDPNSSNRRVRSGVGVASPHEVVLVLSTSPVTFYEFATLFRDVLGCRNALYLDGDISRFYAPRFGWSDGGGRFAGMLAVTEPVR